MKQIAKVSYNMARPFNPFLSPALFGQMHNALRESDNADPLMRQTFAKRFSSATLVVHPTFDSPVFCPKIAREPLKFHEQDRTEMWEAFVHFFKSNFDGRTYGSYLKRLKTHLANTDSLIIIFTTKEIEETIARWLGPTFNAPMFKLFTGFGEYFPDYDCPNGYFYRLAEAFKKLGITDVAVTGENAYIDGDEKFGCAPEVHDILKLFLPNVRMINKLTFPNVTLP